MNQVLYNYYIIDKSHRALRQPWQVELGQEYAARGLSPEERMADRFCRACGMEQPHIFPAEQIVLLRTVADLPDCFTPEEWAAIREKHSVHELGYVSNLSPDYATAIGKGLLAIREEASDLQKQMIDALLELCDRYRREALRQGRQDVAAVLERVPRYGARDFREALQFFRILHFALWLEGDYHNTVGRFDLYMFPYLQKDLEAGKLDRDSALALLEDFFISFNKDSDLYPGVQQGDNGQSMVLGGKDAQGRDQFNLLSELCLEASRNLKLIDPKINLRVSKDTPPERYQLGTELTRAGLGFPQYCNDDVVIPGLIRLGYAPEDAANYAVAACWEHIIPGVGDDIANIAAVNFPKVVDDALRSYEGDSFEGLLEQVRQKLKESCDEITESIRPLWFAPAPMMELLRKERKYRNFGIHGCGIASAADALAAVKLHLFENRTVSRQRLLAALDTDFAEDAELLHLLRYESPKMGSDDDRADEMATLLLDAFASTLEGRTNCYGGIWRAGTGTAMYYLWYGHEMGATADGRRKGEPYGTNYSPNLFAELADPIAVIRSFTKQDLSRTINGGPLTLEFDAAIFDRKESRLKVAQLLQYFIHRGGHQLQLNAVDAETLRNAQKDPERYRQLVVRIWGWSAYFVELDKEYQDHVLARQAYRV